MAYLRRNGMHKPLSVPGNPGISRHFFPLKRYCPGRFDPAYLPQWNCPFQSLTYAAISYGTLLKNGPWHFMCRQLASIRGARHAPLCGIFGPYSVSQAHYAPSSGSNLLQTFKHSLKHWLSWAGRCAILGSAKKLTTHNIGGNHMRKVKTALSILWFLFMSISSPLWVGCIYMNITGHGKGYMYDMGSEADIAVFLGLIGLLLWLLAILPVTFSLCKECFYKKKTFVWLPLLAFAALFGLGICILGWHEFIKMFGFGYPNTL